jgi:hypothetical protein
MAGGADRRCPRIAGASASSRSSRVRQGCRAHPEAAGVVHDVGECGESSAGSRVRALHLDGVPRVYESGAQRSIGGPLNNASNPESARRPRRGLTMAKRSAPRHPRRQNARRPHHCCPRSAGWEGDDDLSRGSRQGQAARATRGAASVGGWGGSQADCVGGGHWRVPPTPFAVMMAPVGSRASACRRTAMAVEGAAGTGRSPRMNHTHAPRDHSGGVSPQ